MECTGNNIQRFTFTYPQYPQSYPQHTTTNNNYHITHNNT